MSRKERIRRKVVSAMKLDYDQLAPQAIEAFFALTDKGEGGSWAEVYSSLGPKKRLSGVLYPREVEESKVQKDFMQLEEEFGWLGLRANEWPTGFKEGTLWPQDFCAEPLVVKQDAFTLYQKTFNINWIPRIWQLVLPSHNFNELNILLDKEVETNAQV